MSQKGSARSAGYSLAFRVQGSVFLRNLRNRLDEEGFVTQMLS